MCAQRGSAGILFWSDRCFRKGLYGKVACVLVCASYFLICDVNWCNFKVCLVRCFFGPLVSNLLWTLVIFLTTYSITLLRDLCCLSKCTQSRTWTTSVGRISPYIQSNPWGLKNLCALSKKYKGGHFPSLPFSPPGPLSQPPWKQLSNAQ